MRQPPNRVVGRPPAARQKSGLRSGLDHDRDFWLALDRHLGANRWPASSRRHWPFSMGLSTMAATSLAYSSGRPSRFGNAASLVSAVAYSSGMPLVSPVANRLGAIANTRMPSDPRSRAMVRHMPAMPALAAVYATCPIWPSNAAIDAVLMMTPRSSSSGSFWLM